MDSFGCANRCCSGRRDGCSSGAQCVMEKALWMRKTAVMEARTGSSFTVVMARDASPFFSHDKAVQRLLRGGLWCENGDDEVQR